MGKLMEAGFCAAYIVLVFYLGIDILRKGWAKREYRWFGIMALVLVSGDSFHLVPRILAALDPAGAYGPALGMGKAVTSVTMTLFYLIMYFFYRARYGWRSGGVTFAMLLLSAVRIGLCLMPQNDWRGAAPVAWGIYRNIPFAAMGAITVALFYKRRADRAFGKMWLAILLSFAFYIPVVLWSEAVPIVGMLMIPKTCMYVWMVLMGHRLIAGKGRREKS